jgi:DNA-binding transcriptional MerR regulator
MSEISMADSFVESTPAKISLPAALCDDLLIKEISSIPEKFGFKIGEVAEMLQIKQYVLRYWESEFEILRPKKAANNQRYYTKRDVENAYIVRKLLHRDRFSIEGAKGALKHLKTAVKQEKDWTGIQNKMDSIQEDVINLKNGLKRLRDLFQAKI